MAQFDVYHNPNTVTKKEIPFLLDLQTGFLDNLATRVVAPLYLKSAFSTPAKHLNPVFIIEELTVVMSTAELAGIPTSSLLERAGTLQQYRHDIVAALDFLFTGI